MGEITNVMVDQLIYDLKAEIIALIGIEMLDLIIE